MTQFLCISFSQFIQSLIAIGYLAAGLLMLMILWDFFSWFYENILKGFLAPLHGHRSYFYKYLSGGNFYSESYITLFFFIKLGRNKKWAIHDSLVGFVKKPFWISSKDSKTLNIFSKAHGHSEPVAFATFKHVTLLNEKIANIHMMKFSNDGSSIPDIENPIGYVDENGDIYKYFDNFSLYKKRIKLEHPVKIGTCAYLMRKDKGNFPVQGESGDADVLKYIVPEEYNLALQLNEEHKSSNMLRDSWFSFRLFKRKTKNVKAISFDASCRKSKRSWFHLFIWRFINVVPFLWNVKAKAFGYGYSKENLNYGKSSNLETDTFKSDENQKGITMNYIGCAALLLLEEQGFLRYEDGIEKDENLGWVETAIISLLVYLGLYKTITQIGIISTVFPFVGPEISTVLIMVMIFLGIWWLIHLVYHYVFDRPYYIRQFLKMLNANVGTLAYVYPLMFFSLIGFFLTFSRLPHTLSAFFLSILIAISMNIWRMPHKKWDIVDPFDDDSDSYINSDNVNYEVNDEELIDREFTWSVNNSFKTFSTKISLQFLPSQIEKLRKLNPFYENSVTNYSESVGKMTEAELSMQLDNKLGTSIVPSLDTIKEKLNRIVVQKKLSKFEEISMIFSFVQQAIQYVTHIESKTLQNENINQKYCRYSRETLYDLEGDSDCKSQLAATLLASLGYTVGFFTNETHTFIGISSSELENQSEHFHNMFFTVEDINMKFLYCEASESGWNIGQIPLDFLPLQLVDYYIINE